MQVQRKAEGAINVWRSHLFSFGSIFDRTKEIDTKGNCNDITCIAMTFLMRDVHASESRSLLCPSFLPLSFPSHSTLTPDLPNSFSIHYSRMSGLGSSTHYKDDTVTEWEEILAKKGIIPKREVRTLPTH